MMLPDVLEKELGCALTVNGSFAWSQVSHFGESIHHDQIALLPLLDLGS